jgi:hypothetical protein
VAYRLYVSATTADGQQLDGLYFLRSDADAPLMNSVGNCLTDFRFHTAKIELDVTESGIRLNVRARSASAALHATLGRDALETRDTCFDSPEDRASVLKYRPLGLSLDRAGQSLKLAEVLRDESRWSERPLSVQTARWEFFESLGIPHLHLESATIMDPIDYRWRIGRTKPLQLAACSPSGSRSTANAAGSVDLGGIPSAR